MPTEEDKRKVACTMILMCMQVIIVCSWKRRIAMRATLRKPRINRMVVRRNYISRLVSKNDNDYFEQLRMRISPFHRLVQRLRGFGLRDSRSVTVEEQVAMFLGTVAANVLLEDQPRYQNRKGIVSHNVLVSFSFDMRFTYVLIGWEESVHDGRVLRSAVCREGRKLTIPTDVGYANCPGFLTPFRGVRYHLRDQDGRRPQNYKELYNFYHSSLRNVVERAIGLLKKRFAYLRNNTFHDIVTQSKIIAACAAIHNFLRDEDRSDELWDSKIEDVLPTDEAHFDEADINIASNPAWQMFREDLAQEMWRVYL